MQQTAAEECGPSRFPTPDVRCVLDVGCGGGAAILKLANLLPEARLLGIDYSPDSLRVAARKNRHLIWPGRVGIQQATVSALPFKDDRFDLVIAIESHYFWPELQTDLREILRVLRLGGTIALIGGVYFGGKFDSRNRKFAAAGQMNCQTLSQLQEILCDAGYVGVLVHEERDKGWFCVTGRRALGRVAEAASVAPTETR